MKKVLLYFISFVLIISNVFCINLYATEETQNVENIEQQQNEETQQVQNFEEKCLAEVKKIGEVKDSEENPNLKVQEVTLKILNGQYKDKEVTANYNIFNKDKYEKYQLEIGDELDVIIFGDLQGNLFVSIQSLHRTSYIFILLVVFFIAIFMLYGKQSLKPFLSVMLSVLLIYFMLIKLTITGKNIIGLTIIFGFAITVLESIINNGLNKKIWISLTGVLGCVLSSVIISIIFMNLYRINVNIINNLNVQLTISSVIIIAIGFCINLSLNIISNLDSEKVDTKDAFFKDLFKLGIIFGQRLSIRFINSLIISFIGMYFVFIIPNIENYESIMNVFSQDFVSYGIISTLSVCIGIIISIPITSSLYALINGQKTKYKTTSENKIDGKRSLKI